MENTQPTYGLQFYLLCASSVLFMASFNMLIPELPAYLESLGGEEYLGMFIALFTVGAGVSRPFSGKLADTIGRIPVMIFGALVCVLAGLVYPVATTVFAFLILRLVHGLSTGFKPTGTTAYLADIIPAERRGEAMGYLGMAGSTGFALGPAIGGYIGVHFHTDVLFYASSVMALLSILVLVGMKETRKPTKTWRKELTTFRLEDVFEPRVIAPSIVMLLTTFSFGAVVTLISFLSDHLGVGNRGTFFTVYILVSITVRMLAGKLSDRHGRVPVLAAGIFLLTIAMLVTGFADSQPMFYLGAVLIGLSVGINSPTIFAWTVDMSHPEFKGRGLSTMFIAMEAGIGIGAWATAEIFGNDMSRFSLAYSVGAVLAYLAMIYCLFYMSKQRKKATKTTAPTSEFSATPEV